MLPSDVIFAVGELPSLGYVGKAVKMSQTPPALPPAPLPVLAEDGEREGVCGSLLPPSFPSCLPTFRCHQRPLPGRLCHVVNKCLRLLAECDTLVSRFHLSGLFILSLIG